jgi:thiamine biosynthesis lipoprotein
MSFTRRQILIGAGSIALYSGMPIHATQSSGTSTTVIAGSAFATSWRLTLPKGHDVVSARHSVENIVKFVDGTMSPFKQNSEISRFNSLKSTQWIDLSPQVNIVVSEALRIADITGGAFDPTIGPIVARYGFGPINNTPVGNHKGITIRNGAVKKSNPELSLDLCGIAKGYALDQMVNALDLLNIQNYFLELGGEVFTRGKHPTGRAWQVGIELPMAEKLQFEHIIKLENMALATSGNAVNSYQVGGMQYSHIIDPHTKQPTKNELASVSVISKNGMQADALATALMVMGSEQGVIFATQQKIATLFIAHDGKQTRKIITGDFANHILL